LWSLVGTTLGYFSFLLDKVDGEIARYKDMPSVRGIYLDQLYHLLFNGFFCLAITLNAFWLTESSTVLVVGMFCVFFVTLNRFNRKLFYSILAKARFLDILGSTLNSSASRWKRILDMPVLKIFSPFTRPDFVLGSYFVVSLVGTLIAKEAEAKRLYLMLYVLASAGYFIRFSLIYFFYGIEEQVHELNQRFLETHEREMERLSRQQR
jgi:phosphatidylglycerophosphate synthase